MGFKDISHRILLPPLENAKKESIWVANQKTYFVNGTERYGLETRKRAHQYIRLEVAFNMGHLLTERQYCKGS